MPVLTTAPSPRHVALDRLGSAWVRMQVLTTAPPPSPQVRVALDDLVDVDFIHEYFDELEASLSLAKEVKSACTSACTSNGL